MKRLVTAGVLFSVLPLLALRASACSTISCLGNGMKLRRDFVVTIVHGNRPLAGVKVQVTTNTDGNEVQQFSGTTDRHGKVRVVGLPPGEYWLKAELLAIYAAYHCFHVASAPSRNAKHALKYEWGDLAPATRRIAGKLMDCEPAKGENSGLNVLRCVQVPITGARFKLQNPTTGVTHIATSDESGSFAFEDIQSGTYVLHVEGGRTPTREYDSADVLISLSPNAKWDTLLLTKRDPGGGSCGGTSLDLKASVAQ